MKIVLLCVGKTDDKNLDILIQGYFQRIKKYIKFSVDYINSPKSFNKLKSAELKKAEGELIIKKFLPTDYVFLLDEKGKGFTSNAFASQIQKTMNAGHKNVFFVVGGAFGFSKEVYSRANAKVSLSEMTTTHQLIRLIFVEQLYRAFTILNGHPYHND